MYIQHRPAVVSSCVAVTTAGTTTANKRIYVEIPKILGLVLVSLEIHRDKLTPVASLMSVNRALKLSFPIRVDGKSHSRLALLSLKAISRHGNWNAVRLV